MADNVSVTLRVTPDQNSQGGHKWEFDLGEVSQVISHETQLFVVFDGAAADITFTIEAGVSGSTCVFRDPVALTVTPSTGDPFNVNRDSPSTLIFRDDNRDSHPDDISLGLQFFALFDDNLIASPDPTIVNAGTDQRPIDLPSQARPKVASAGM